MYSEQKLLRECFEGLVAETNANLNSPLEIMKGLTWLTIFLSSRYLFIKYYHEGI